MPDTDDTDDPETETAPEPDPEPGRPDEPDYESWDVPLIDPDTGDGWDEPVKATTRAEAAARAISQADQKAFVSSTFISGHDIPDPYTGEEDDAEADPEADADAGDDA